MTKNTAILTASVLSSLAVFLLTFFLVYDDTQATIGSVTAAILTALLFWISFMMLSWLIRVFTK
ncbi:MAG: hypothetical protein LW832_05425 [Parachlamydia sp.]|jgi:hypothetical protein|nr:hypothetical protein [Parachlamydia sp.]